MAIVIPTKLDTKNNFTALNCYHCGEVCEDQSNVLKEKAFCCEGCKMVYEILNTNDLTQFYHTTATPAGISLKDKKKEAFTYLDDASIVAQLIDFKNEKIIKSTFYIPQIHCASCIWLLENLFKINEAIVASRVNFLKKQIYITYDNNTISYRKVVELLASIGYSPTIHLDNLSSPKKQPIDMRFYYQLGVAGFAFGNIMLFSLPEYLGLKDHTFKEVFGYLNILLILPVVLYSAKDYWRSAWQGLQQRQLNIDVPITLGIITLFVRSVYEIGSHTGSGYLDSLVGLVFFLLIGKWFQKVTYHQLSFERDYKSYFPIATTIIKNGVSSAIALSKVRIGDILLIRNKELIPADGILQEGTARIDYSFVTGESEPVRKNSGEWVYAGGKQLGSSINIKVSKPIAQSYLTQLWNEEVFQSNTKSSTASRIANQIGKYFTYTILLIAFATLHYWLPKDIGIAINAFTAVLIIACPCAIALSIPFTFGNTLRLLSRHGFYLKNTQVIEKINAINTVVFDKTGTITKSSGNHIQYEGEALSETEKRAIAYLTQQSNHPVSQQIRNYLQQGKGIISTGNLFVIDYEEVIGQGIYGSVNGLALSIEKCKGEIPKKGTIVKINNQTKGIFLQGNVYRTGFEKLMDVFRKSYDLFLVSGDNDQERQRLEQYLPAAHLYFDQSPKDKLTFLQELQQQDRNTLMLGDGLNDAGALQQAEVGVVIAESTNNFTPACDAILDAQQFDKLPAFIQFIKQSIKVVYASYLLAFIYNSIGLSFAVTGTLSPVVAAILMPLSSITIVLFGVGMTYLFNPNK